MKVIMFNGPPSCVDGDTEFFNGECWKPISEYKDGECVLTYQTEGRADVKAPLKYIESESEVEFHKFKGVYCDMALTSNHTVAYITGKGGYFRTMDAESLANKLSNNKYGFDGKIPATFELGNTDVEVGDDILCFTVMYSAEATVTNESTGKSVISLKHDYKKARCRDLLKACGITYNERDVECMPGFTRFYFLSPVEKGLPNYFYALSKKQAELVKNELFKWDGDAKLNCFRTSQKDEADIAQFVIASTGSLSNIFVLDRIGQKYGVDKKYTRKSLEYRVTCADHKYGFGLESVEMGESFRGKCYCFTTDTGYWVARREGKIFITGNSGKDAAADVLWSHYPDTEHRRFKDRLFEITASVYGVSISDLKGPLYERDMKEKPHKCLGWLSPRQALIRVSEEIIKPSPLGHNYFGEALADSLDSELTVVSDSGFYQELLPVVERVGAENVLVVKVLRTGYTFEGDSRNYLDEVKLASLGVEVMTVENFGSLEEFEEDVLEIAGEWLGGKYEG